jgi:hypothetical protein
MPGFDPGVAEIAQAVSIAALLLFLAYSIR